MFYDVESLFYGNLVITSPEYVYSRGGGHNIAAAMKWPPMKILFKVSIGMFCDVESLFHDHLVNTYPECMNTKGGGSKYRGRDEMTPPWKFYLKCLLACFVM